MSELTLQVLMEAIDNRVGIYDIACPLCGPSRRAPLNRIRKVLRVWNVSPAFLSYSCARCGERGYARDGSSLITPTTETYARIRAETEKHNQLAAAVRLSKAMALWRSRQSLRHSIAETYLREARAYRGPLPPTLGILPQRDDYPPTMIAAFGVPEEAGPGSIALPETRIAGVHLTRLAQDGSDRERNEKSKIMIGFSRGTPIVLAPWTDGQALVVTEGIEDALSAHEATGLCAWAAGSASRLPAVADALPSWVECLTVLADDDRDGRRHALALAARLSNRNVETRLSVLGAAEIAKP